MIQQLQLFGALCTAANDSQLQRRFLDYHESNPHVYKALLRIALRMRRAGWRRYGVAAMFEALRYHSDLAVVNDAFKLNHDYRSRYARLLMEQEPELVGFFKVRRLRA